MALPIEIAINNYRHTYQVFTSSFDGENTLSEPFVLPPLAIDVAYGSAVQVSLLNYFQENDGSVSPASNADFVFAWGANSTDATITISATNIWSADVSARQTLRQNFAAFLVEIEQLEIAGILLAGGTGRIQRRLADAMPLPFSDVLYFHHGVNSGLDGTNPVFADLQAGMRVRVESTANQFVAPGSAFNGLVTTSQAHYGINAVVSGNRQQLTFDPFFGSISAPNLSFTKAANPLDFATASRGRRHFRLVYPSALPDGATNGDLDSNNHVVIVGADTLIDLQAATDNFDATATEGNQAIEVAFLRGRAYIVPEIKVTFSQLFDQNVQHVPQYVTVGTTLRNLLDAHAVGWNPSTMISRHAQMVFVKRLCVNEYGIPGYKLFRMRQVRDLYSDPSIFDLPLVAGDRVMLRTLDV